MHVPQWAAMEKDKLRGARNRGNMGAERLGHARAPPRNVDAKTTQQAESTTSRARIGALPIQCAPRRR